MYKCATVLLPDQVARIVEAGRAFTRSWAAHGAALDACVEVLHDCFVVIAVDEEQAHASGCSIDKSVQFIQAMERDLGLSLTDRMVIWYEKQSALQSIRVPDLPTALAKGELSGDTIVFNDLVSTRADLDRHFRSPLRDTWMARYL